MNEGYYERLWRDEVEAGQLVRKQRDRALKERDEHESRANKAERLLLGMTEVEAGAMTLDQFAAQARSIGLMDAVQMVTDRRDLLCAPGKMKKWAFEFSLLARDIEAAARSVRNTSRR